MLSQVGLWKQPVQEKRMLDKSEDQKEGQYGWTRVSERTAHEMKTKK